MIRRGADMLYMDVSSIALRGLQRAQVQVENSAGRIARWAGSSGGGMDSVDLSQDAVALLAAKDQFGANISVLKVADKMQKSVINLMG